MGLFLFAAGYVLGSQSSEKSFEDVLKALNSVRESDEFKGLVRTVRMHAAESLRGLAGLLERMDGDRPRVDPSDLLERVRLLASRR